MDIKDFILIGGGLLIAAVVVHGFWIAWRARRDPLRLDLVTDFPESDDGEDELRRLRAELPNGGARVVGPRNSPRQGDLDLGRQTAGEGDAPVLLDPSDRDGPPPARQPATRQAKTGAAEARGAAKARTPRGRGKTEPRLEPAAEDTPAAPPRREPQIDPAPGEGTARGEQGAPSRANAPGKASVRDKVKDVILPERTAKADEPREPRRWPGRKPAAGSRGEQRRGGRTSHGDGAPSGGETRKAEQAVDELIMVYLLAPKGAPFVGAGLVEALRARGLRYGDMNIFHRVHPETRAALYSVANVVEPGTFDMADLDAFRSPGVCFFMQLPGPEQPMEAFDDMIKVARDVAVRVDGSLLDEQRSVMTGQTVEHYRQRISDFCRRRMSMRA